MRLPSFGRTFSCASARFPARSRSSKASHASARSQAFRVKHNSHRRHHRSKFSSGSPWPIKTMFVCGASCALCSSSGKSTCAKISPAVRLTNQPELRRQAKMAIHRAARLRRNANRLPSLARHKHQLRPTRASASALLVSLPFFPAPSVSGACPDPVGVLIPLFPRLFPARTNTGTEPSVEANRCFTLRQSNPRFLREAVPAAPPEEFRNLAPHRIFFLSTGRDKICAPRNAGLAQRHTNFA